MSGTTEIEDAFDKLMGDHYDRGGSYYTAKHFLAEMIREATARLVSLQDIDIDNTRAESGYRE